ncbi:hypothetical protein D3C87_1811520 [compost metagenome]
MQPLRKLGQRLRVLRPGQAGQHHQHAQAACIVLHRPVFCCSAILKRELHVLFHNRRLLAIELSIPALKNKIRNRMFQIIDPSRVVTCLPAKKGDSDDVANR